MAGIKIHNYPIERTSFGDDDYYDIDYWTGTAYETAKIKGSVLKSALGYSFVDIEAFISGYTLSANDAGKVITNSNTGVVRSLVINNTLSGAGNSFHVKGRVAIQPLTGVNIDLPDGSTITEPSQYTCEADTHYVLHRKASTGNDWVLSAINKDTLTNLGLSDLEQMDLVRVFEVFEDGELKFITNHANSDAIFRVGENSEERFGEITLNSETFNQTVAVQNPTNDGQGIITRVNPNEFDVDSRDDITDVGTRRNRLYFNPQSTTLEFTESGRLILRNSGVPENIFEDLSPTKKGLQYNADYSADYTDRSLVDKEYVDDAISAYTPTDFDYIDFNTAYTPTQQEGRLHWDADYGTLDVDLEGNNINLKVGLDNLYYIKNQSGSTINKGTVVRAVGTLGSSGRILGDLMIADNTIPHYFTLGIAGENILNGEDGYVYEFGLVRQIDTTGTPYGETWADGDILYVSPTTAGGLTKVKPTEPNLKIQVAIVIDADANGSIFVRPSLGEKLEDLHNVETSGATNGDLIAYNTTGGYWEYTKTLNGNYIVNGNVTATTYYGDGSNLTGVSGGHEIYSQTSTTALPQQPALRFKGYLEAVDDAVNSESVVDLSSTALKESNIDRFALNGSDEVDLKITENTILTGDSNGFATTLTGTEGSVLGFGASNEVQEFTAFEAFNILKETGIIADKTLALTGIDTVASNVKATFAIDEILLINTTANSVTVNVGSTALGTDVVNAVVVGANATVLCGLGTRYFSSTVNQDLYISSGSWNSANLTISVTVKKIHYV